MKMIKSTVIIVGLIAILFQVPGCNKIENLSNSSSKLICMLITGVDLEGTAGSTTIFSDVVKSSGTIINDTGTAELTAVLLNPGQSVGTFYQDIIVDQVDVKYSRADGLNVEGRDVPFGFSQRVNARIAIGETLEIPFILVQHTAKLESPLVELINVGQEKILKVEAQCTFHGKDVAGNRVEPTVATVSVWFANFADED